MVLKKSALTPEQRDSLRWEAEDKRAEGDIFFAAKLALKRKLEEQAPELSAVKTCRAAFRLLAKDEAREYREVMVISRKPEVGSKLAVHIGSAELSDRCDLLKRVSRSLGIKAGSLPLEEAQVWAGNMAAWVGPARVAGCGTDGIRRSYIVDVQTGVMAEKVPDRPKVAESETISRATYTRWLQYGNEFMVKAARKAKLKGLVKA